MTADLVVYTPPSREEWQQLQETAAMVAATDFVPKPMRGNKGAVMACLLTGRELGIGPMQALRDVYIVNGRPCLAATLMVSRVRGRGHQFKTVESTAERAVVQVHRKGETEPEPPVEFTIADAKRAELGGKDNWRHYPKAMLWSRAAAAACRRDAPEALGGVVYTPEEIESIPEDGPATTVTWGEPATTEAAPAPTADTNGDTPLMSTIKGQSTRRRETVADKTNAAVARAVAEAYVAEVGAEQAAKDAADLDALVAAARSQAPAAGRVGEASPGAGGLPDWLATDITALGINETKAKSTLAKTYSFLRESPWPDSLARITDTEHARQLLTDRYAARAEGDD